MLLDVRPAHEGTVFKRGDKVVLLEYDAARRLYLIISEDDFLRAVRESAATMELPALTAGFVELG